MYRESSSHPVNVRRLPLHCVDREQGGIISPPGYKVASQDLRKFAKILNESGTDIKKAHDTYGPQTELSFFAPVVGQFFKAAFNDTRQTILEAMMLLSQAVSTAGTTLHDNANKYEAAEEESRKRQHKVPTGSPPPVPKQGGI
jgi:hypothetical protein